MIVKCASCQTRFKIGDDKVTEKGVKVRCTKCGTVFVVRKGDEEGTGPAPSPRSKTPPASDSVGSLDDLFSLPSLGTTSAAAPAPAAGAANLDDPFAGFLAGPAPSAKNDLMPGEFTLGTAPVDQALLSSSGASLPAPAGATPMSDLLGLETAWPAAAPSPASKPPRSPASRPPKGSGSKPPKPPPDASDPFEAALDPLGSPASIHPPPDPFANLASAGPEAASFGLIDGGGSQSEPTFDPLAGLSLDPASVPLTGEEPAAAPASPESSAELFERPPRPPPPQPAIETQSALAETTVERQRGRGLPMDPDESDQAERPLSVKIFSALAGASVVTLLLLFFVAYRNGGRVDLHDPLSAVFAAFGFSRPRAVSESLTTHITQSGLYANLRGEPMLFVRGSVENLSGGPQRVGLKLEVTSQGQVVATAEGVPGLFPTPEDLFDAKDGPAVKAALDRVFAAPQAAIPPGGRSDFLLVVPSVPAAVLSSSESTELKVTAHPLLSVADLSRPSANQLIAP
jgi:predicted Zn finger-like uncharacterized protein